MSALAALLALLAVLLAASAVPIRGRRPHEHGGDVEGADDAVAAFELVVGDLRSGVSLTAAVSAALHRHHEVLPWLREALDRGEPLDVALAHPPGATAHGHATARTATEDGWFAHGLALCGITGGSSAEVLDRAVGAARERRAWQAERTAQAAQAQLSARLLTALPLGFSLWGVLTSRSVRTAYREVPLTLVGLLLGLVLNALGWWWMRRLVRVTTA